MIIDDMITNALHDFYESIHRTNMTQVDKFFILDAFGEYKDLIEKKMSEAIHDNKKAY